MSIRCTVDPARIALIYTRAYIISAKVKAFIVTTIYISRNRVL